MSVGIPVAAQASVAGNLGLRVAEEADTQAALSGP